jgi:preprotein translocase subunit SecG
MSAFAIFVVAFVVIAIGLAFGLDKEDRRMEQQNPPLVVCTTVANNVCLIPPLTIERGDT